MKKIIKTILLLVINIISFGQTPIKPIIPINSLELQSTIKLGKELYSFIEEDKNLRNGEYIIMVRKERDISLSSYQNQNNNEGNDIPNYGFKGISTNIYIQGEFLQGYKNGFWKTSYKNKLVKTENWNNGLILGRYRVYNTKGELLYKTTFGSQGNGMYRDYYYQTGVLKQEGCYKNGKKEGKWCEYDEQGNIKKTTCYKEGLIITE